MKAFKIIGFDYEECEKKPVAISMWYDRHRREWVLYPVDEEGNQLAEATYEFSKANAERSKKGLEDEYGI